MITLEPAQAVRLRGRFLPERPGPLVEAHVLQTGHGTLRVDRWPDPRVVLAETAGNYSLTGDPAAVSPAELANAVTGFLAAQPAFEPLLTATFPGLVRWDRVVLTGPDVTPSAPAQPRVRRLKADDAAAVCRLSPELSWIAKTWDGPDGLSASGRSWGAFESDRLLAVACTFFEGTAYEDIGVVTEAAARGRGLSPACAAGLCGDIIGRGRRPSWTTAPENTASLRVAAKLGFIEQRRDVLYLIGVDVPA